MSIDPYRLYEIITTVMITTINILWDILKNINTFYKDRRKKVYITLTTHIESRINNSYIIKVRANNKSNKPIEVYTCHLLTNHNEDIADSSYKESTQVDRSRHSIAKEQIHNITIRIPYRGYLDFYFKDVRLDSINSFIAYIKYKQDGVISRVESHSGLEKIRRIIIK